MSTKPFKEVQTDHPILPLLTRRYSPYVFDPRPVEEVKLLRCLEAARWSASSYNEQPWVFFLARRTDEQEFQRALSCLVEANQEWAKSAGVLMITAVAKAFKKNGKPNRVAEHDLGLAMGNFTFQATELGLAVHQMAGVNLSVARQTYGIPDSHDPMTGVAVGYAGDPEQAENQQLADRDKSRKPRKPLAEFVFSGGWGTPAV